MYIYIIIYYRVLSQHNIFPGVFLNILIQKLKALLLKILAYKLLEVLQLSLASTMTHALESVELCAHTELAEEVI